MNKYFVVVGETGPQRWATTYVAYSEKSKEDLLNDGEFLREVDTVLCDMYYEFTDGDEDYDEFMASGGVCEIRDFADTDGDPEILYDERYKLGKHYLIGGNVDWADEFDVTFFELIGELDYAKYMAAKRIIGHLTGYCGFGTNEYWDDFDYLDFDPVELSDEEYRVLYKFHKNYTIQGRDVMDGFYGVLNDELEGCQLISESDDLYRMSLEKFETILKKYADMRDE